MKRVVVDASIVVKWLVPGREGEEDLRQALEVLRLVRNTDLTVLQPPHWLAEAAAVVARLSPETASEDIEDLWAMDFALENTLDVYLKACELSVRFDRHLFDTLYHAVALTVPETTLITADERYYRKAKPLGHIILLQDFKRNHS